MQRDRALAEHAELTRASERLGAERDEAVSARGAAMVMRNATRAGAPSAERVRWVQRAVALVVLTAVLIALGIVLHVL
jgi:hypothetical protein